jgi:hypothetical protein
MRRLLVTTVVIGAGALGFAAVSQAGMPFGEGRLDQSKAVDQFIAGKYAVPECRIEKTLKYDFNGNPYVKKVRVCA